MKVTYIYTPLGESASINELICPGDATGESPLDWRPSTDGQLQPAGFPGAQEIELFARGNAIVTRTFRVHRTFLNRQLALAYTFKIEALPGTQGLLNMQNEGLSGGQWTALVGCQRAFIEADLGIAMLIDFLFIGLRAVPGPPSNQPPEN